MHDIMCKTSLQKRTNNFLKKNLFQSLQHLCLQNSQSSHIDMELILHLIIKKII